MKKPAKVIAKKTRNARSTPTMDQHMVLLPLTFKLSLSEGAVATQTKLGDNSGLQVFLVIETLSIFLNGVVIIQPPLIKKETVPNSCFLLSMCDDYDSCVSQRGDERTCKTGPREVRSSFKELVIDLSRTMS